MDVMKSICLDTLKFVGGRHEVKIVYGEGILKRYKTERRIFK